MRLPTHSVRNIRLRKLGIVTSICFAEVGNDVRYLDVDPAKIKVLEDGGIPKFDTTKGALKSPVIFDGCNLLDVKPVRDLGLKNLAVGR